MKKPFKLRSQGQPFKMIGASPLKLNPVTGAKVLYKGAKALYKSKKTKKVVGGAVVAGGTADYAMKKKSKGTGEKLAEVAYDWSGVGDVVDVIDWTVGKLGGTKKNTASRYPWGTKRD